VYHAGAAHVHLEGLLRVAHGRVVDARDVDEGGEVVDEAGDVGVGLLEERLLLLHRGCRGRRRRPRRRAGALAHRCCCCCDGGGAGGCLSSLGFVGRGSNARPTS
jgi:hypothetical protein